MNNLLVLCLQIMLFALISPIAGQDETEINQNNGDDYQNNGADYQNNGGDYQNNGYIGDGDNYENNGGDYQNNGDDYQNNGADYQNNGADYQNNGDDYQTNNNQNNGLDSSELQHLKNMQKEMASLNRRLKPPSLRNTHSEFKPQSLDLGLDNGEQNPGLTTLSPDPTVTTTDTTTTITEIQTTSMTPTTIASTAEPSTSGIPTTVSDLPTGIPTDSQWGPWGPCEKVKGMNDCERKRSCPDTIASSPLSPSTCAPPGAEESPKCECPPGECNDWAEWGPCKEVNVGPTLSEAGCKRERICKEDQDEKMSEECPGGVKPPLCGEEPCERWFPWTECQQSADGSKCEKTRACDKGRFGGRPADYNETQDCAGTPPQCKGTKDPCREWSEWSPCKQMGGLDPRIPGAIPGKCRREKICRDGLNVNGINPVDGIINPVEDCPNVEPPMCGITPPTGNCTKYDYKGCGPTCIRCGCCIDPPGFVGVGEYGCEPCFDTPPKGRCEPQPINNNNPNLRLRP